MPANLTNDKEALFEIGGASSGLVIFTENGSLKTTIAGGNDESELTVAGILEAGKSYWVVMEMRGTDGDSTNNTLSYFVGEKQENAPIRFTAFNTDYQPWTGVDWTGTDAGGWGMVNGAVQGPADVSYASFSGTFNEGRFYSNQTFAALWKTAGTSSESFTFRQSNNNNTNHSQASAALSLTRDNFGPAVNTAEATSATSIELTLTEAFTERDTVAASDFVLTVQDVDSPPTVSSILILGTTITLNLSEDLIVDLDSTVTLAYTMSQNGGSLQDHADNRLADFASQAVNIDALSVDSVQSPELRFNNPVKSSLYITSDDVVNQVRIFSINGQQVFEKSYETSSPVLDLSTAPSGIYILEITTDKQLRRAKLVKE